MVGAIDKSGPLDFVMVPIFLKADAWEHLYLQAARQPDLLRGAVCAQQQQREANQQQQLAEAAQQRQQQLVAGLSILSDAAASELAVRHNLVVQRWRVQAKDEVVAHEAGGSLCCFKHSNNMLTLKVYIKGRCVSGDVSMKVGTAKN